jgi:hypothetical protein
MYQDEDGVWYTYYPLSPGTYKYKFYIDGEWGPDPDVYETVPDGRGGFATQFEVTPPRRKKGVTITTTIEDWEERRGFSFAPAFDYNRVDGVYLAAIIRYGSKSFPEPSFYVEGGYSKKRDRGLYRIELEQPVQKPLDLWIGATIYDVTDHNDSERITDWENLVAALFRFDYRDYFDRRGIAGFVKMSPWEDHDFKLSYMGDEYRPLEQKAHTTLFGGNRRFPPNPRKSYQICYDPESETDMCSLVKIRALELEYEYDTRNCTRTPTFGWRIRGSGEWARQSWGSDLQYSRYTADFRRYHKISRKQLIGVRLAGGMMAIPDNSSCGCVPGAYYFFPKQYALGGIGSLPGYPYKEYRGTHMLLGNLEYNYLVDDDIGIMFFTNGGDAVGETQALNGTWDTWDVWKDMQIKFDAGVAVRVESSCNFSLTLGLVQRLDDLDLGGKVIIRGSRIF